MKIRRMGAQLFHADGQTNRYDEANSHFSQFFLAPKRIYIYVQVFTAGRISVLSEINLKKNKLLTL